MTRRPKARTTEETLRYILKHRIAYGADEGARYVEHVCPILIDSRMGPGFSDDMFTIENHDPQVAELRSCEVAYGVSTTCGSGWGFFDSGNGEVAKCRKLGRIGSRNLVRTGSSIDRVTTPHSQLLGHLNPANAPPKSSPLRIAFSPFRLPL